MPSGSRSDLGEESGVTFARRQSAALSNCLLAWLFFITCAIWETESCTFTNTAPWVDSPSRLLGTSAHWDLGWAGEGCGVDGRLAKQRSFMMELGSRPGFESRLPDREAPVRHDLVAAGPTPEMET